MFKMLMHNVQQLQGVPQLRSVMGFSKTIFQESHGE